MRRNRAYHVFITHKVGTDRTVVGTGGVRGHRRITCLAIRAQGQGLPKGANGIIATVLQDGSIVGDVDDAVDDLRLQPQLDQIVAYVKGSGGAHWSDSEKKCLLERVPDDHRGGVHLVTVRTKADRGVDDDEDWVSASGTGRYAA